MIDTGSMKVHIKIEYSTIKCILYLEIMAKLKKIGYSTITKRLT